jgi:hypothetical protein
MTTPPRLPHDPLTPIDPNGEPSPAAVRLLREEMYANARAIKTKLGGGCYGHLGQLMRDDRYIAFAGVPYILADTPPEYTSPPPPAPKKWWDPRTWFNEEATTTDKEEAKATFEASLKDWEGAQAFKTTMQQLIIKAVPTVYLSPFRDSFFGYADIDPGEVLDHLIERYGLISKTELAKNAASLKAPWNPDTPITTLFEHGRACRKFAREGGDPISDTQYITTVVQTIDDSGVLELALYTWRNIPDGDQTVDRMIDHFTTADKVRRDHPGKMRAVLTANGAEGNPTPVTPSPPRQTGYCWTHGACTHTSDECRRPAKGHIKTATLANWEALGGRAPKRPMGVLPEEGQAAKRHKREKEVAKRKIKEEARAIAALAEARALVAAHDAAASLKSEE